MAKKPRAEVVTGLPALGILSPIVREDRARACIPSELPAFLQVEVTSACNLRCVMCPLTEGLTASSEAKGHMSDATWAEVTVLARAVKQVVIAGFGEPLANPRCLTLLRELDALGVRIGLATNGTPLAPRVCAELVRIPHLTQINVSVDSPDPSTYRAIRRGELGQALGGLRNLMSVIDDPNRVTTSCVVTATSLPTLARLPPILAGMGVRRLVLQSLVQYSPGIAHQNLAGGTAIRDQEHALRAAAARSGVELCFTHARRFALEAHEPREAALQYLTVPDPRSSSTRACLVPWESPFVDKDGRIFPCCRASSHKAAALGDLRQGTLLDAWHGPLYQSFRRAVAEGHPMPAVCRECNAAPLGPHPFRQYAAEICVGDSVLFGRPRLRLVVRNVGVEPWRREDRLHLGTSRPRDRPSAFYHPEWLTGNRIASFSEVKVPPGGTATFQFHVRPTSDPQVEDFQLVFEDRFWLPNTTFQVGPVVGWPRWIKRCAKAAAGPVLSRWRARPG
jgi:radical SAM protein with 4Fe4S-binding SPASM domain